MSWFTRKQKKRIVTLVIAILAALLAFLATQTAKAAAPGLLAGAGFGDGRPQVLLGVTYCPNPNAGVFAIADMQHYEETINLRAMFNLELISRIHLHLLAGPEVEFDNTEPTRRDALTYLNLSTGIAVSWKAAERLSIWGAVDYASNATRPGEAKFGVGIVSWLGSP